MRHGSVWAHTSAPPVTCWLLIFPVKPPPTVPARSFNASQPTPYSPPPSPLLYFSFFPKQHHLPSRSFNASQPIRDDVNPAGRGLFEREQEDLLHDLYDIPARSCDRRVNEFVKRVRWVGGRVGEGGWASGWVGGWAGALVRGALATPAAAAMCGTHQRRCLPACIDTPALLLLPLRPPLPAGPPRDLPHHGPPTDNVPPPLLSARVHCCPCRAAKIHFLIMGHLRKQIPYFGQKKAQEKLLDNLAAEFQHVQREFHLHPGEPRGVGAGAGGDAWWGLGCWWRWRLFVGRPAPGARCCAKLSWPPDPTPASCCLSASTNKPPCPCPPASPAAGDFPDVDRYREILSAFDLSRFPKLDKSMIRQVGPRWGWAGGCAGQGRIVLLDCLSAVVCRPPMRTACVRYPAAWLSLILLPPTSLLPPRRSTTRCPWTSPPSCARWRTHTSEPAHHIDRLALTVGYVE